MVSKKLQSSWDATNGLIAHSLTKDGVVEAMDNSGCIGCYIGIESGNREILQKIKKSNNNNLFKKQHWKGNEKNEILL